MINVFCFDPAYDESGHAWRLVIRGDYQTGHVEPGIEFRRPAQDAPWQQHEDWPFYKSSIEFRLPPGIHEKLYADGVRLQMSQITQAIENAFVIAHTHATDAHRAFAQGYLEAHTSDFKINEKRSMFLDTFFRKGFDTGLVDQNMRAENQEAVER